MSSPSVAVTIPVSRPEQPPRDQFSLDRCLSVLGRYPIVFYGPESLDYSYYRHLASSASIVTFPDRYFATLERYSELMLSPVFYEAFKKHEFILIYHLDAFVFRDELEYWCSRDFDYIGAPWWDDRIGWRGVGNGGFCLRKPGRCLEVLKSRHREDPRTYWAHVLRFTPSPMIRAVKYLFKLQRHLGIRCTVDHFLRRFIRHGRPEDEFWGFAAVRYFPDFRVAPVEEAIRFAVEAGFLHARSVLESSPPFGCHRGWFLRMISRYVHTNEPPVDEEEALVWQFAARSGITSERRSQAVDVDMPDVG